MASIRKEIAVEAPAGRVWDAIRDVGAVHTRLVRGMVLNTRLDGDSRLVTFANGETVVSGSSMSTTAHGVWPMQWSAGAPRTTTRRSRW